MLNSELSHSFICPLCAQLIYTNGYATWTHPIKPVLIVWFG